MGQILRELQSLPKETGCLGIKLTSEFFILPFFLFNSEGSEVYYGADGIGSLIVQYWRSLDHLNAYARSQSNKHYGPWKELYAIGKKSTNLGFWHEAFEVKAGKYECVYVCFILSHLKIRINCF